MSHGRKREAIFWPRFWARTGVPSLSVLSSLGPSFGPEPGRCFSALVADVFCRPTSGRGFSAATTASGHGGRWSGTATHSGPGRLEGAPWARCGGEVLGRAARHQDCPLLYRFSPVIFRSSQRPDPGAAGAHCTIRGVLTGFLLCSALRSMLVAAAANARPCFGWGVTLKDAETPLSGNTQGDTFGKTRLGSPAAARRPQNTRYHKHCRCGDQQATGPRTAGCQC